MSDRFEEPTLDQVQALLRAMVGRRVAVIGDVMMDVYLIGKVRRISAEAPVPIFEIAQEERMLGGAANVAKCLVALGAKVRMCGVIGRDSQGDLFLEEAAGLKIGASGVLRDSKRPTTVKSRVVAQQHQMLRLDAEDNSALTPALDKRLAAQAFRAAKWADAVILSDYSKGTLSEAVCRAALRGAGRKPVVVDPKDPPWTRFRGATVLKPNRRDLGRLLGFEITDAESAVKAARLALKMYGTRHVLLTRSAQGATLASRSLNGRAGSSWHLAARQREIFDTTGAGDVIASTVALALAAGTGIREAIWLANVAAGIKVAKFGTAAVSDQDIIDDLGGGAPSHERKVMTRAQAARYAARLRNAGKRVVFTNGCFDILHYGHVSYLERSRRLGDALIVGLNSDASVRRLKGAGRPVQPAHDRERILASQACVDAVVRFAEDTPLELIKAVRPAVLCKGADYKRKQDVVGWREVERWGGKVVRVPIVQGRSTTNLIKRGAR
ncbi:MAG: D-glycero-beta-D-manno-heptose 1-phosphate adenylyltransferase [Planctomycetes bacterium]|nr:D-glycero-beta-D-manno-heptose 1-phosphate adenylyltransferase [Planctomycetota bacterium]